MESPYSPAQDVTVLPSYFPVPGMGFLPVNAFVIKAKEPVLIDTGMGIDSGEFIQSLRSVIDPEELRWIIITHDDCDHTGNLQEILQAAPQARLAINGLGAMRQSTAWSVPMDRAYFLNDGDSINAGDRTLTAFRPPLFDNPTTLGFLDSKSRAFFSSDCFGAIIPGPAQDSVDIPKDALSQGMIVWATADSPWIHQVEPNRFGKALERVRALDSAMILSSHMAPSLGKADEVLKVVAEIPLAEPFVGPDQAALEAMLAQMTQGVSS